MRKKRILQWVIAVIISGLFFKAGEYADYLATQPPAPEKQQITVYAPEDMEEAFNHALKIAGLEESYEIVMTDKDNANICVGYGKQNDDTYQKICFSPFAVAYNTSANNEKKLKKAEVLVESQYDENYYEIDFLKIINEVIGEGKWANLNIEDENQLKVFYPEEDSIYWKDFHDFLLVTVNNGKYPQTETEMQSAEEVIEKFLNSDYTEGVTDFYEQVQRTGGFPTSVIYILPEKLIQDICDAQGENADIHYPINTVYFNYYIKGDETGKQIIDVLDKTKKVFPFTYDFYYKLAENRYRSVKYKELINGSGNTNYERDVYNVAKIPETVGFTTMPSNPTIATEATSE